MFLYSPWINLPNAKVAMQKLQEEVSFCMLGEI